MKKTLLFLFSFFISYYSFSQSLDKNKSNFKGGIRAGLSISQISGDELAGFYKAGAYAGGYVNIPFTQSGKWLIQMELNFIMKGSSTPPRKSDDPNFWNTYTLNLFYTETPIIFKYKLIKGFELELGPCINFLFASREKGFEGIVLNRPPFRLVELAFLGGANYLFKEHWGISIRYSNSIIPVRIPGRTTYYAKLVKKQYNSVLTFSLYYQF